MNSEVLVLCIPGLLILGLVVLGALSGFLQNKGIPSANSYLKEILPFTPLDEAGVTKLKSVLKSSEKTEDVHGPTVYGAEYKKQIELTVRMNSDLELQRLHALRIHLRHRVTRRDTDLQK